MRVLRPLLVACLLLAACRGSHTSGSAAPSGETASAPEAPAPAAPSPVEPVAPSGPSAEPIAPSGPTAPATDPTPPSVTPPPTAALAVLDGQGGAGPFRIGELAGLALQVQVSGATPGEHQVRLDVVSPEGTLYAQLPARIAAGAAGGGAASQLLQVRGTDIESLHRTGTWTFRAYVDGGAQPNATAQAQVTE